MDVAEEDQDERLQRSAPELLRDLKSSLGPFLWKTTSNPTKRLNRQVRVRDTARLVSLLEPFQELPQLLDPELQILLEDLSSALLVALHSSKDAKTTAASSLLMPVSLAICKLLYTICKIRGEKIVVRFFSAETRHLELLLSVIEKADASTDCDGQALAVWSWEERYIVLLWLSHLLLAPFDLATISSGGNEAPSVSEIERLILPQNLPGVALRVIPIAVRYLASAGKERDAAKVLLVRLSMRKDMQELGLLNALVGWALKSLQSSTVILSTYFYIGILSYLAGVLASSSATSDMDAYVAPVFETVQSLDNNGVAAFQRVHSSALAKKTVIKVLRSIAVLVLRQSTESTTLQEHNSTDIVEATIGHLLEALADNDTPVRIAASKALSIVILKLESSMATQVIEAVLESLNNNVLWTTKSTDGTSIKTRDLSAVDPLEWHGLVLTLSQLLYRRSPPPETLSGILHALLIGLSFELRSASGSSVGTNVRDAACFGIWALARRYTTAELQSIDRASVLTALHHEKSSSIMQVLASELVAAATLDSAGNIRRGASAALQELIGRHPDTIENGISNVQAVDYHRIALRSRAMGEVAPDAAALSKHNDTTILDGLFGWRGIGDGDSVSRRNAASCIGKLATMVDTEASLILWSRCSKICGQIEHDLNGLKAREVEERHGLLLALAEIIKNAQGYPPLPAGSIDVRDDFVCLAIRITKVALEHATATRYRKDELIVEGCSRIISAACGMNTSASQLDALLYSDLTKLMENLISSWLLRKDIARIDSVIEATQAFVPRLEISAKHLLISSWLSSVGGDKKSTLSRNHLLALAAIFELCTEDEQVHICEKVDFAWCFARDIDDKIVIMQVVGQVMRKLPRASDIIQEGLDDYTTDARGDVGSLVRVQALETARLFLLEVHGCDQQAGADPKRQANAYQLLNRVLRLAVEKLDRVRVVAQRVLAFTPLNDENLLSLNPSSYEYFRWMLNASIVKASLAYGSDTHQRVNSVLSGYVTSADTGSEGLVRNSRAALVDFCEEDPSNMQSVTAGLLGVLKTQLDNDRVLVPALSVTAFLFDAEIFQRSVISFKSLYIATAKAHYKTGNVRKIEAAVRVYAGLLDVYGGVEVRKKLGTMLLHTYPAVRNAVADVLFVKRGIGKGVDWPRAKKEWSEVKLIMSALEVV